MIVVPMASGKPPVEGNASRTPAGAGQVVRGARMVAAGRLSGRVFWFGSLVFLVAQLSPGAYGTVAIALLLIDGGTRLTEAGTRGELVLARTITREDLRTAIVRNVAVGAGLSAAMAVLAGPVVQLFAEGGRPEVVRAMSPAIAVYALSIVPMALLARHLAFPRRAAVEAGTMVPASLIAVAAAILGAGVWALVLRQLLYYVLLAACAWVAARTLFPSRSASTGEGEAEVRTEWGVRRPFLLYGVALYVLFNLDNLIVGAFSDAKDLGLYALAFRIAFTPVLELSHVFGMVVFPLAAVSSLETARRRSVRAMRLAALVLLPGVPVVIVLAPHVVPAVFGSEWRGAVAPFQVLVVAGVAYTVLNMLGESLAGTGHMDFRARVGMASMVAMAGALLVLVPLAGIVGAAAAHLLVLVGVIVIYVARGMPLLGLARRRVADALTPVVMAVLAQAAVTAVVTVVLDGRTSHLVASGSGALLGLAVAGVVMLSTGAAARTEARA